MRIIQFENASGQRCLGMVQGEQVLNVTAQNPSLSSVYAAFIAARRGGNRLQEFLQEIVHHALEGSVLDYADLLTRGKVRAPISEAPRINPGSRRLLTRHSLRSI